MPKFRPTSRSKFGFAFPYPKQLGNALASQFGKVSDVAYRVAAREVVTAVTTSGADRERVLQELNRKLEVEFPDAKVASAAARVGKTLNKAHQVAFFTSLAGTLGATLVGSDTQGPASETYRLFTGLVLGGGSGARLSSGKHYSVPINVEPSLLVDDFVKENVRLIRTVRSGVLDGMHDQVVREVVFGKGDPNRLRDDILRKWRKEGVPSRIPVAGGTRLVSAEKHAALIARDQLSKLNLQVTRSRQRAAGIDEAEWVTQGDTLVRPLHKTYNGRTFNWETGLNGVFPGAPVACRCWAKAVIDLEKLRQHWEPNRINVGFELVIE